MAKEQKAGARSPDTYGDVVQRLDEVVKRLESGELSLEDSLRAFEEGVGLVRKGEKLLSEAERRVEQLLAQGDDPEGERPAPLKLDPPARTERGRERAPVAPGPEEDDIPF